MTAAPDLLATIVAASRRMVEVRQETRPARMLEAMQTRQPRGDRFRAALESGGRDGCYAVIAECKRRSPSKGILRQDYDPAAHARAYQASGAAAISVLTEPTFFDGSLTHLEAVRAAVELPVLRKDFIVDDYQLLEAAAAGADAVLLIVGALEPAELRRLIAAAESLALAALVEAHDEQETRRAVDAGASILGVNSRNLRTLDVDLSVLDRVGPTLPAGIVGVAESGIRTRADLDRLSGRGYRAFLVGERLIAQPDPGLALRELMRE